MARRGLRADIVARFMEAEHEHRWMHASTPAERRRLNLALGRGDLVSPAEGVYALPGSWASLKPTERLRRTVRTLQDLHPNWAFCGPTAALVHGLAVSFPLARTVHVVTSRRAHARTYGRRGIERHTVEGDEIQVVDGIRVTSLSRTAFDCARSLGFRDALAIVDSALSKRLTNTGNLKEAFVRMQHGFTGRARAIETLRWADGRAESGGESVARAVMIERGFRLPELQHVLSDPVDPSREYRVDFYWDLGGAGVVFGELDGLEKYVNPQMTGGRDAIAVLADERLRESRVSGTGARVMRFSYSQVLDRKYFTHLLCCYGIPRDAEIPWVAVRSDDPEALLTPEERLALADAERELTRRSLQMVA